MFVVHGSPVDKESIDIDGCFKVTVFFFLPSYAFHLPFFTFGASNKDVFMHDQCKNGPMLQTISS